MNTYLIDSNILVYAYNTDSPYHKRALQIVNDTLRGEVDACISYQNLYEFYAVITDPKRVEKPLSLEKACEVLELCWSASNLKKIFPEKIEFGKVIKLLRKYGVSKQRIFDVILVATMLNTGIKGIYTKDTEHFQIFEKEGIKVIDPFK